jgi:hypothetical protein
MGSLIDKRGGGSGIGLVQQPIQLRASGGFQAIVLACSEDRLGLTSTSL